MGLFIGASILTLLEILDYIYEAREGGLAGAPQTASVGCEKELWEKQRVRAGFLVELFWLESQAVGSLSGYPDRLATRRPKGAEENPGVLVGVHWAASPIKWA